MEDFASVKRSDTKRYAAFFHAMRERGVFLPPAQFEAWFLSTAHTAADDPPDRARRRARASASRSPRRRFHVSGGAGEPPSSPGTPPRRMRRISWVSDSTQGSGNPRLLTARRAISSEVSNSSATTSSAPAAANAGISAT